jgi:hypothetical protein
MLENDAMSKKFRKGVLIALLGGTMLQFGGCFNLRWLLQSVVPAAAVEFVIDNDAVFDLFEDGNVPAA